MHVQNLMYNNLGAGKVAAPMLACGNELSKLLTIEKYQNLNHYENACGNILTDGIPCQGIEVLAHLKHRPKVREAALITVPTCGIGSSWISCVMDTCVKLTVGQCTNR